MKSIAVIGGGITGVTTAYALARRGFSVTLFERHRYAAMETSFANGGQLSATRRSVSRPGAGVASIIANNPRTQSSGRMLTSFRNGGHTLPTRLHKAVGEGSGQ